jgi:hypothetical protein
VLPVPVPYRRGAVRTEAACGLAGLGGALVLLESFLLTLPGSTALAGGLIGSGIVALSAGASFWAPSRRPTGGVIAVLGVVSLVAGGGFYLGAILSVVGGMLLLATMPLALPGRPAREFAEALGPPCPSCGRHVPAWSSRCPYCGSPEP